MMSSQEDVALLSGPALLARTRELVDQSQRTEANLLLHLDEIDERKLYLECAYPSMFAFCVGELRFSEDAAYSRIMVARAARRLPAVIEALRSGQVHLTGLRLLAPHLTAENHRELLIEATGKTKREIEEMVARLAPQPTVAPTIRKLPERPAPAPAEPLALALEPAPARPPPREDHRRAIAPLAEKTYRVEFTANQELHDKLRLAQDLLRHRIPDGDLACIVERALDLLIDEVKKERFAVGRKPRKPSAVEHEASSRHIPDAIKRKVYERDGGRCTFVDERGRRCPETGNLEFDHLDGFARTRLHDADRIRLLCRAHNQHAAERTYGRAFMERARSLRVSTCPGTGPGALGPATGPDQPMPSARGYPGLALPPD